MAADKDTIYVDVDDEITTIIDKVRGSSGKIVALVLPKRATVFQSIVNMKLLKRAADVAKKHLVLITTEANLMPLAGTVGLHVASTPQSKPEIPPAAAVATPEDELAEEALDEPDEEYTADNAGDRSVGELAHRTGHVVGPAAAAEAVTLDEGEEDEASFGRKDRHLKVPNFNKFRLRLVLGVLGLIALIAALYVANVVLPKAVIAITTNSSQVNVNFTPTLDTAAKTLDTAKLILPAKSEQQQKTTQQQVDATGQKNNGDAATGTVTMTAQKCSGNPFVAPADVPAGTGISTNGLTFITGATTSFHGTGTSGSCYTYSANAATSITAQNPGTKYNVSGATFTIAGRSDASATGSTSGGTDDVVKVVSQSDIDNAKQKLAAQDTAAVKASLDQVLLTDGLYPLDATFNAGAPVVTTSKNVGDQADNVTVTQAVTYTMYGVKKADIDTLIKNNIGSQIDTKTQTILDDGLGGATITVTNSSGTTVLISLETTATIGPDINAADIKRQSAGKRVGDVKAMVNAVPGVTNVDVQLSPFWVSTVPTNPNQVSVTIDKK